MTAYAHKKIYSRESKESQDFSDSSDYSDSALDGLRKRDKRRISRTKAGPCAGLSKQNKPVVVRLWNEADTIPIGTLFKYKFRRFVNGRAPHDTSSRVRAHSAFLDQNGFAQGYSVRDEDNKYTYFTTNSLEPACKEVKRPYQQSSQPPSPSKTPFELCREDGGEMLLYCLDHADTFLGVPLGQATSFIIHSAIPIARPKRQVRVELAKDERSLPKQVATSVSASAIRSCTFRLTVRRDRSLSVRPLSVQVSADVDTDTKPVVVVVVKEPMRHPEEDAKVPSSPMTPLRPVPPAVSGAARTTARSPSMHSESCSPMSLLDESPAAAAFNAELAADELILSPQSIAVQPVRDAVRVCPLSKRQRTDDALTSFPLPQSSGSEGLRWFGSAVPETSLQRCDMPDSVCEFECDPLLAPTSASTDTDLVGGDFADDEQHGSVFAYDSDFDTMPHTLKLMRRQRPCPVAIQVRR